MAVRPASLKLPPTPAPAPERPATEAAPAAPGVAPAPQADVYLAPLLPPPRLDGAPAAATPSDPRLEMKRVDGRVTVGVSAPGGEVGAWLTAVKTQLEAEGLPSSAPNARVAIVADGKNDTELTAHGEAIARTIAGPHALAQGAQLFFSPALPHLSPDEAKQLSEYIQAQDQVTSGAGTLGELARTMAATLPTNVAGFAQRLEQTRSLLPPGQDGRARLFLNISNGVSISQISMFQAYNNVPRAPDPSSALYQDLHARLGPPGPDGAWDAMAIARTLRDDVRRELEGIKPQLDKARATLSDEVARLREEGVMVFGAAGNDAHWSKENPSDGFDLNMVPGMVIVGATNIGKHDDPNDDRMGERSSGAPGYTTLSTVGEDMPVGDNGTLVSGTSYAAPMALSIAALMTEANPRLTPDDLEAILTHPEVARHLPDTDRDGAGQIDPVAAVRMAKAWDRTPLWR